MSLLACTLDDRLDVFLLIESTRSKMQKQDIKTMEVNRDAQDEYNIQQACMFSIFCS